jgi:3-oxoadipate enol-lactonase
VPFVDVAGARLYHEVHGPPPGSAPALVFAHGAGGNHLSWWQQVPHFAARWTCVTFDHRGYGQSADAPGGPGGAAYVDDLERLLDHLGLARATLVAQSMGGWTSLGFALRHPGRVERLVMSDTHGGLASDAIAAAWAGVGAAVAALPPGVNPAAGARMAREQPALHFLYTQISALNPAYSVAELMGILRAAGAPPASAARDLRVPVLFVAGEEDVLIPPAVLAHAATHFPDARVVRVPEAGHSVYFERPAAYNAIVDRFLAGR